MNATGSSDADNYAIRVAAMQKKLLDPVLRRLDMMVARQAGLSEPLEYEWVPLTDLSEKDRAETAKLQGETLNLAYTDGVIDEDEYRSGCPRTSSGVNWAVGPDPTRCRNLSLSGKTRRQRRRPTG